VIDPAYEVDQGFFILTCPQRGRSCRLFLTLVMGRMGQVEGVEK
jgi:hypothetical protein